jgi:hypothetical protein
LSLRAKVEAEAAVEEAAVEAEKSLKKSLIRKNLIP